MLLDRTSAGARWHLRPDGPAKVTGSLKYLTDHRYPECSMGGFCGVPCRMRG